MLLTNVNYLTLNKLAYSFSVFTKTKLKKIREVDDYVTAVLGRISVRYRPPSKVFRHTKGVGEKEIDVDIAVSRKEVNTNDKDNGERGVSGVRFLFLNAVVYETAKMLHIDEDAILMSRELASNLLNEKSEDDN